MSKETKKEKKETKNKSDAYDFDNFEQDTLTLPRNEAWSNFKSWKDAEIGDKEQGFIRDVFYLPETTDEDGDTMKAQRGVTIEKLDGTLMNITIKTLPFVLVETDNLRLGDPLTVVFDSLGEKKKKTHNAPKIFKYYGRNLPENMENKTVKELYEEDMMKGGTKPVQAVEGEEGEAPAEDSELEKSAVDEF